MTDSAKKEPKKGIVGKIKEVAEDKEEQLQYLATLIRVIVLVWSAGILTLLSLSSYKNIVVII